MQLTTWNVNGLRAILSKGLLQKWLQDHQPDVLMLQEIKARPEQIDPQHQSFLDACFPHQFWNPARRPGYSGVLTLARQAPLEIQIGLGDPAFDQEGRLIALHYPGFWLFNLYFPNGQHDHGRVPFKLDFYARLLEQCDALHAAGQRVILCGDFNTAHQEIDLRHPKANQNTSGFLPVERDWVSRYLEHGFIDIFRRRYPQRAQYTWWTYRINARRNNVGWRLDYFLVSQALAAEVADSTIHEEALGSDHCPVSLLLEPINQPGN